VIREAIHKLLTDTSYLPRYEINVAVPSHGQTCNATRSRVNISNTFF